MRKMNLAVGSLIFLGFLCIMLGVIARLSGVTLMAPVLSTPGQYLIVANTCFLVALVIDWFERSM